MFRRKHALPLKEKRELESVKKRLDKLEPRVNFLETQYRLLKREES